MYGTFHTNIGFYWLLLSHTTKYTKQYCSKIVCTLFVCKMMFTKKVCNELFPADYSRAEALCKEYRQTKGPGSTAKPSEQLFFLKLGTVIKNTLEKCQRENGFM